MSENIWDKYAQVLVDYSTDVQKGDLVVIRAESTEAKELVKAVYKRVIERGGNPIVRMATGDLTEVFLKMHLMSNLILLTLLQKWNMSLLINTFQLELH